jgi:hypothetical protein
MPSKNDFHIIFAVAVVFVFLVLIKFFDISYPLMVVNTTRSTELSVVGEGKVEVVPDIAHVDLGITVNNAASVNEAQKKINDVNNSIVSAMAGLGIKKTDIKTSNYSIYPEYSYEGGTNRITGYNGNVSIKIKVKSIDLVAKVIEEGTKAGANQVQGASFSVESPEKYREEARDKAIQNAKEQAERLAKKLGIKLGRVVNIVESSASSDSPIYALKSARMEDAGGGPDIEPGSQTITSVVTLYFEKK